MNLIQLILLMIKIKFYKREFLEMFLFPKFDKFLFFYFNFIKLFLLFYLEIIFNNLCYFNNRLILYILDLRVLYLLLFFIIYQCQKKKIFYYFRFYFLFNNFL